MNIINKILLCFITLFFIQFSLINIKAQETTVNIDDEELPAIDPFQGGAATTGQAQQVGSNQNNNLGGGLLGGMRLVGVIIGENGKLAILSAPDGSAFKFEEDQEISEGTILIEILNDYLIVQDANNLFFEVYMNNVIKPSEG